MVSLAEPFSKEGYKGTFVLLEPITVRDYNFIKIILDNNILFC